MTTESSVTENVVRNHLEAFLEQKGIAAIVEDYDESARFYSEAEIYRGKERIGDFFADFIGSLPDGAIDRSSLRSMRVEGRIAYITWSVGSEIPLGTDTLVVDNGKIVAQTFAMYAAPPERLAWVEPATGMHTTSTLDDLGDGTTAVVIRQRNVPATMRLPEARAGFLTSLDKLEEHLTHLTQGDRS